MASVESVIHQSLTTVVSIVWLRFSLGRPVTLMALTSIVMSLSGVPRGASVLFSGVSIARLGVAGGEITLTSQRKSLRSVPPTISVLFISGFRSLFGAFCNVKSRR